MDASSDDRQPTCGSMMGRQNENDASLARWTLDGRPASVAEVKNAIYPHVFHDIAVLERLEISEVANRFNHVVDPGGPSAIIGRVVAFERAIPIERIDDAQIRYVLDQALIPGYVAIRYGKVYVGRLVVDVEERHGGKPAIISAAKPALLL